MYTLQKMLTANRMLTEKPNSLLGNKYEFTVGFLPQRAAFFVSEQHYGVGFLTITVAKSLTHTVIIVYVQPSKLTLKTSSWTEEQVIWYLL